MQALFNGVLAVPLTFEYMEATTAVRISKHALHKVEGALDHLATEEPLGLHLQWGEAGHLTTQSVSVTMRTPGDDAALSVGFFFTEGIINKASQIALVLEAAMGENTVLVALGEEVVPVLRNAERNFYTTSSCGVCGKASIDAIRVASPYSSPANDDIVVDATTLYRLPHLLRAQQKTFNSTGGLHASALFTLVGEFISLKEDVGRHNALDKLIGEAFLQENLPLSNVVLLLSGRASFELVQKAVMAGIRVIAAIGAPSSLAVQMADEHGVTLVGFLRNECFNVYTGGQRICSAATKHL